MTEYIKKLKTQHNEIRTLLNNVQSYVSSSKNKIEFVIKLRELADLHMKEEDKELYPVLKEQAKTDISLSKKLTLFANDAQEISEFSDYYIHKYVNGNFDGNFIADTGKYLAQTKNRMLKEEIALFVEYDKHFEKK